MKLLSFLGAIFSNGQTKRFLGMKNAARWERIGSYSLVVKRTPEPAFHCSICQYYSAVPDERIKGLCRRYSAKNVVLLVHGGDSRTCYKDYRRNRHFFARLRFRHAVTRRHPHAWAA